MWKWKEVQACLSKYRSADLFILYFLAENSPQRTPGCVACMWMMAHVLESPSPDMRYLCSSVQLRNGIEPFVRLAPDLPGDRASCMELSGGTAIEMCFSKSVIGQA